MANGFESELSKWQSKVNSSLGKLKSIESSPAPTQPVTPKTEVKTPSQTSWSVSQAIGKSTLERFEPDKEVRNAAEVQRIQYSQALTEYEESMWFAGVYSAKSSDLQKLNITSYDDYIDRFPPEQGTSTTELDKAREYIESLIYGRPADVDQSQADYGAAKEQLLSPLDTRTKFQGIHLTTVEEMTRWLRKEVSITQIEEPEKGVLLDMLTEEVDLTDEELEEIQSGMSDWIAKMQEYEAEREKIRRYKLGLETPEMPERTVGEWIKQTLSTPVLSVLEIMEPYWTKWNYPESAIITRGLIKIDKLFPRPFNSEEEKEQFEIRNQLEELYQANRESGMGVWDANSKAWEDWEQNEFAKMALETVFDPVSYLGFGLFIKLGQATKGVRVFGKIFGGLGDFERGFITVTEYPFGKIKNWIGAIPKSTGQRASKAGVYTKNIISTIHGRAASSRGIGKTMEEITQEDFITFNRKAIEHGLNNPEAVDDLSQLTWNYVVRDVIKRSDVTSLASRVGSKLTADDITSGMVESIDHIVNHTKIRGSQYHIYNQDVASKEILLSVLEASDTAENMKIVKGFIRDMYKEAVDRGFHIATELPMRESVQQAAELAEKKVFTEAAENIGFKRMHGGFTASIMNNVIDPLTKQVWSEWLDKKIIMPFARSYLITGSYAPMNWVEEVLRTIFGRGGSLYGKNTPAELQDLTIGLLFDKQAMEGAYLARDVLVLS